MKIKPAAREDVGRPRAETTRARWLAFAVGCVAALFLLAPAAASAAPGYTVVGCDAGGDASTGGFLGAANGGMTQYGSCPSNGDQYRGLVARSCVGCGFTHQWSRAYIQFNAPSGTHIEGLWSAYYATRIDNVEQVRAPAGGTGSVLYKVKASSQVDGLVGEPFAIAARNPLTPLTSPAPTAALVLGAQQSRPGENVTIDATVSNPSSDLDAEAAQATLELPPGVELVAGTQTQALGTLARQGDAGDSATASWTVRGTSDGVKRIVVRSHATKYGESFSGEGSADLTVQSPSAPPPPPAAAPPPPAAPPPAAPPPPPPGVARSSPGLRVRSAVLGRTTLRVRGTTRAEVRGELVVTYSTSAGGRRVRVRRRFAIRSGRFVVTIRLPLSARGSRRGSLLVRYGGDPLHLPDTARRVVRRAR